MTLAELKAFIQDVGLNDNGKVCILIAYNKENDEYELVNCDADGKLITVAG